MLSTAIGIASIAVNGKAFAQSQGQASFSVPSGPLNRALTAFGRQAGLQITYLASVASGVSSPGVSGTITPDEALAQLLAGTGLSYSFTNANTVAITDRLAAAHDEGAPAADGSLVLDTITIQGAGGIGAEFDPSNDYTTPGAVANVNRAMLDVVPPTSTGDILRGVTGVTAGQTRNGGGFEPNIRGSQGMGRVKVIVDGAEGSAPIYRGYGGNADTNYLDPDLIAGYSVEKGPSSDTGAIGGAMKIRTFEASDIIKDDRKWGVRLRGMIGDNVSDGWGSWGECLGTYGSRTCAPSFGHASDKNYSGSAIVALRPNEYFEFLGGVVRRQAGNYHAGKNGEMADDPFWNSAQNKRPGAWAPGNEILGTFSNSTSQLFKATFTPTDEHRLTYGFNRYTNEAVDFRASMTPGAFPVTYQPGDVEQTRHTFSYAWKPQDNPWINLTADVWNAQLDQERLYAYGAYQFNRSRGAKLSNRSNIDLPWFTALLDVGGQFREERLRTEVEILKENGSDGLFIDRQDTYGVYANLQLPVTDWLTVHGGARHDWSRTEREKAATKDRRGQPRDIVYTLAPENSVDGSTFNAGLILKPTDALQIYGKYSRGWRAPSLAESMVSPLAANNFSGWFPPGTSFVPANPEKAENYEFGINFSDVGRVTGDDVLGIKIAYFDNRYDDYIAGLSFPTFNSADSAKFRGFEVSYSHDFDWIYTRLGLTRYLEASVCGLVTFGSRDPGCRDIGNGDHISGLYVPPKTKADLTLGVRLLDRKLEVGATVSYVDGAMGYLNQQYVDVDYTLLDVFASYDFDNDFKLALSATNLTDQFYFDAGMPSTAAMPAPGRTFRATLTKEF